MDVEQINNIMTNADRQEVSYSDAQWLYLQDVNQGNYNNILQYYTTPLKMQFIDYHNAYLRIPFAIEMLQSAVNTVGMSIQPPYVALRQSILSLITNVFVATDQGQTIVNDLNTQFINNIRLEVEHDEGWMRSDGPMLGYAYDRPNWMPSQSTAVDANGYLSAYQTTPSVKAFQGNESGNTNNAPLVNDPNQYGNNHFGSQSIAVTIAASVATPTQPTITFPVGAWTGNSATAPTEGNIFFNFDDGRVAVFPFSATTGATASAGVLTLTTGTGTTLTVGGVNFSNQNALIGTATTVTTLQAVGSTSVLDQPLQSELVTIPLQWTVDTAGTASVLTNFGGLATTATTTAGTTFCYGQIAGLNPNCNQGFLDRITLFQNSAEYQFIPAGTVTTVGRQTNPNGAHLFYYRAIVPLKLLHDFFHQLNFPIINVGFNFQFTLAQSQGQIPSFQYPPFQTGNNSYLLGGGTDTIGYPSIYYGQDASAGAGGTRLYYRVVKFSPADNARMAEKLTTGFTKSIKFISTDWFREPVPVGVGASNHQFQFSTSVVHPLRVWVLPYPNPNYGAGTAGTQTVTAMSNREALQDPTYAPGVECPYFIQTNILVNNIPYFRQNFLTIDDLWEQLREQFDPDNGSMIDYRDFRTYKRGQCYDLTRISDRLQSPTEPVNLVFTGNRADGLPYPVQMYYLTERLNQITFRFSSSDVAIVVGNLD